MKTRHELINTILRDTSPFYIFPLFTRFIATHWCLIRHGGMYIRWVMHNNVTVTVSPHELLVLISSRYLAILYFYLIDKDRSYTLYTIRPAEIIFGWVICVKHHLFSGVNSLSWWQKIIHKRHQIMYYSFQCILYIIFIHLHSFSFI